ncbi:hypothetical protein ACWD5V_08070 [Streptomyces sp. NPDC002523]
MTPIGESDIAAGQKLADAFVEAGRITKGVDVPSITDNLLPVGHDSSKLTSG